MEQKVKQDYRSYPDWVHHELMNWSRWCWLGPWPHPLPMQTCASIEREYTRYRLPEYGEDESPPPPRIEPNEINAQIVDRVWKALTPGPHFVLRAEYPQRMESGRLEFGKLGAARRLGMSLAEYEAHLVTAVGRVLEAFEGKQ